MKFLKKLFGIKEQPKEEKQKAYEPIRGISVPLPDNKYTRDNIDPNIKSNNVEIDRTPSPRKHYKPKKQTSFFVVGTQHYNLQEKVNEHIKSHKRKTYQTSTSVREVVEDYGRIYKYGVMRYKRVELVHERDNQYNENAIAVYFRKSKVGYIKNDDLDTKDNPIIVLKADDYNKIQHEAIKEERTAVVTIGEYFDFNGEIYLKYEISDKEYKLPFVLRFNVKEDNTNIKGKLEKGKKVKVYASYPDSNEWRDKIYTGIIEQSGRDHLILSDPSTGLWYLIRMLYVNYIEFDERINYNPDYSDTFD